MGIEVKKNENGTVEVDVSEDIEQGLQQPEPPEAEIQDFINEITNILGGPIVWADDDG